MEKPTKKEMLIIITVSLLVVFAWLCRLSDFPNTLRSGIYLALYIYWGFTLHHRLVHPQVKRLAVGIAALTVLWIIIRTIKYGISPSLSVLYRYLWYLYYLPMIFIPLSALFIALTIGLPETKSLPKKFNLLWLPAIILFLFVVTNDLHQLVFVFFDSTKNPGTGNYGYSVVYYFIVSYLVVCNLSMLVILAVKNRRPKSFIWSLIPCIPFVLLIIYCIIYVVQSQLTKKFFGDLTAVFCLLYAAAFELCINCGLIRSNTGYGELFRASKLGAHITDTNNKVCISSNDALDLTAEQIINAEAKPIFIEKSILLKSKPIHYGHILWQEDVLKLTETIKETEENCKDLDEQNSIRRENLEAKKTILALQEKNRAADMLHKEIASQLDLIDNLLTRYYNEKDKTIRRNLLAGVAVVGAYIKRYGNLLLVCERKKAENISDLSRCFEESFNNLELLNVDCLCSLPSDIYLNTKDMLNIYRTFEEILEDCIFEISNIWVNGREKDGQILLHIEFVSNVDLSGHSNSVDVFSCEDDAYRFTFNVRKGGAEK